MAVAVPMKAPITKSRDITNNSFFIQTRSDANISNNFKFFLNSEGTWLEATHMPDHRGVPVSRSGRLPGTFTNKGHPDEQDLERPGRLHRGFCPGNFFNVQEFATPSLSAPRRKRPCPRRISERPFSPQMPGPHSPWIVLTGTPPARPVCSSGYLPIKPLK
jgi:hypothetical protein